MARSSTRLGLPALAALGALLLATDANAQLELPENNGPEIVVTGQRVTDDAVREFIRDIGIETYDGQITRWHEPVCPQVTGMRGELNAYVSSTISAVARAAGARSGGFGCRPNVVITVTEEPSEYIAGWRERRHDLFQNVSLPDRRRLIESDDPVRSWSLVNTRGRDGGYGDASSGVLTFRDYGGATRVNRMVHAELGARFVVIDLNQFEGATMQQLSGFIGMMALAEFDIGEPVRGASTILNLFHDPAAAPEDITDWDIAYLRGLYASSGRYFGGVQRGQIRQAMQGELEATVEE